MNSQPFSGDPTPEIGSQTDMAPVGRGAPKPPHEMTAAEEAGSYPWKAIAESDEFRALIAEKLRFIIPATVFFSVYYFALPILVGYCPALMARKVWGEVNLAYLFALSQFPVAWALAAIYVGVAAGWDRKAAAVLSKFIKR
jgi:uncharacterized membrane protein (DUF485 family)